MNEKFTYSKDIIDIIDGLTKQYNDCSNIVLYGSTALNALSFKAVDNKYEFYSDLEFIVIPKDSQNENNKSFRKELINRSFNYLKESWSHKLIDIPFVDVNPVSEAFFTKAQLRISNFEIKNNSMVLKGNDLLKLMPTIDVNNYNKKIQNIEIIKALKILLLESNKYFLCKDNLTNKEKNSFSYFLSSCFLNVLRTLLPQLGYFKLTTKERINVLVDLKRDKTLNRYFTEDFINKFTKVYNEKSKLDFGTSIEELFSSSYLGYKNLLCMILEIEIDKTDKKMLLNKIESKKSSIFYGDENKTKQLSLLTCFFISSLENMYKLSKGERVSDAEIKNTETYLDRLIAGQNSYKLMNMINKYGELEKNRWKIIGSKD